MLKQKLKLRVQFSRTLTGVVMGVFSIAAILYGGFAFYTDTASAATSNTLNFQARLENASGAVAPDGYYNVEFKLYDVSSAGTALWTETYFDSNGGTAGNDNRIRVRNGYLTVNLGSLTAFPGSISWDQELWITMNVGGRTHTATPTYDGEMNPRLKLTGVPYAFKAGQLAQFNASTGFTSTLQLIQPTVGNQTFQIADQAAAGTYTLCVQNSTACGFAAATGAGGYIQNGTALQTANFAIQSAAATSIGAIIKGHASQSADLLQLQNSTGTVLAQFDSGGNLSVPSIKSPTLDTATAVALNIGTSTASSITIGRSGTAATINSNLTVMGTTELDNYVGVGISPSSGQMLRVRGKTGSAGVSISQAGTGDLLSFGAKGFEHLAAWDKSANYIAYGTNNSFIGLATPNQTTTAATTPAYYYVITATNDQGETVASNSVGTATNTGTVSWDQVLGATGYRIYRNTTNSFATGSLFLTAITSGSTLSYVDTGAATAAGLPPTVPTGTTLTARGWGSQSAAVIAVQDTNGANRFRIYENGRTMINLRKSADLSDNRGSIEFSTPNNVPGIVFRDGTGGQPTDIRNQSYGLVIDTRGRHEVTIDRNGRIGVGTISPSALFAADTDPGDNVIGLKVDQQDTTNNNRAVEVTNSGTGLSLFIGDDGTTTDATPFVVDAEGRVGIGMAAPTSAFDLQGAATVRGMAAPAVSAAGQGVIYFDSTLNKFRVSENGGAFVDLLGGGGGSSTTTLQGAYDNSASPALITTTSAAKTMAIKAGTSFDTTTLFQVQNAAGVAILNVDSTNQRVGIGNASPQTRLEIGSNSTADEIITVRSQGKAAIELRSDTLNATGEPGGAYILFRQDGIDNYGIIGTTQTNGSAPDGSGFNGASSNAMVIGTMQPNAVQIGTDRKVNLTIASGGAATFKNAIDTSNAFRVQNAAGTNMLIQSTTTGRLTIEQGGLSILGLANPAVPSLTSAATGGGLAAATYIYRLAATSGAGETQAILSSPDSVTTTGTTSVNTLSWTAVTYATGYNIYRSTDGGTAWHVNSVAAGTTSITDNGTNFTWTTAPPAGKPDLYSNKTGDLQMANGSRILLSNGEQGQLKHDLVGKAVVLANYESFGTVVVQGDQFIFQDTTGYNTNFKVDGTGIATFRNRVDSTSALQVQSAAGSTIFNVDTTNQRVGIGTATPSTRLEIGANGAADEVITVKSHLSAVLDLQGDTDNATGEDGTAYILFRQDADTATGARIIGSTQDSGRGPNGALYTNAISNSLLVGTQAGDRLQFGTNSAVHMTMSVAGNVGIGTVGDPAWKLSVAGGGICVDADTTNSCPTQTAGTIAADGAITANAFDLAERYASATALAPGTLVSVDRTRSMYVTAASGGYSPNVIGVVSTDPGLVLGWENNKVFANAPHVAQVALAGRVPVKVTAENGPVAIGDPLTSSATRPGYAMKATGAGMIIGRALEPLAGSEGSVMTFIKVTWYDPTSGAQLQGGGDILGANLVITGSAQIGNLNVSGATKLASLEVTTSVSIGKDLKVIGSIVTTDITVNGHIITAGATPQVVLDELVAKDLEVIIAGNDTSGTITLTTDEYIQLAAGKLVEIRFAKEYTKTPRIMINGDDGESARLIPFAGDKDNKKFMLSVSNPLTPRSTFSFTYFIVE